ncbi:3-hydroxy-3-methylglutaryl-coenzyme A reductase [Gigaspora margarita]|uniref:hydroxymethylglutaryl-CoA reductase (NADPH) n=1 Tax=Gigaspora margarita TaxID=4874 RepID=A0A8H4ATE8_GIGMA|nr:3-hydroxy-3-methylglutaryl-coenzyme A reductase [Gigaspora margarita]
MRKIGSCLILAIFVLLNGLFAFMSAFLTIKLFGITINPILLSEAIPFLIITIGFEKPFALTKTILTTTFPITQIEENNVCNIVMLDVDAYDNPTEIPILDIILSQHHSSSKASLPLIIDLTSPMVFQVVQSDVIIESHPLIEFNDTSKPLDLTDPTIMSDEDVLLLVINSKISHYNLEKILKNNERAVKVYRAFLSHSSIMKTLEISILPMEGYDYLKVMGICCENVIGYMPIPIRVAGPLKIDDELFHIPMATTEGCLVASTSRGCKAINEGGGAKTVVIQDLMTRGSCVEFPNIIQVAKAKHWLENDGNDIVKHVFNSTSRFAKLKKLKITAAGCEKALEVMNNHFSDIQIISISRNYCSDKKPATINWIEEREKSVITEAIIPGNVVQKVLKTNVEALVKLNISKNLVGSAIAGSVGGFNAHATNMVTAIYIAPGQGLAQNVKSSNCITIMESINNSMLNTKDLHITCTIPSIEVGTIGGGTTLGPQSVMLKMLGVKGSHPTMPGENAKKLARIIYASVMARELSLCAALATGHLVKSHIIHNRAAKISILESCLMS